MYVKVPTAAAGTSTIYIHIYIYIIKYIGYPLLNMDYIQRSYAGSKHIIA